MSTKEVDFPMKPMMRLGNHIKYVQENLNTVIAALQERLINHDRSKYCPDECVGYVRANALIPDGLDWSLPEDRAIVKKAQKHDVEGMKLHPERNDHHAKHFEGRIEYMPLLAIIEMVCDWKGAHKSQANAGNWKDGIDYNINTNGFTDAQKWVINEVVKLIDDESHPDNYPDLTTETAELFRLVDAHIRQLKGVEVVSEAKQSISYGIPEIMPRRYGFVRLLPKKKGRLVVRLRLPLTQITDPKGLCRTDTTRQGWPTACDFDSADRIEDIMALIEQAHRFTVTKLTISLK